MFNIFTISGHVEPTNAVLVHQGDKLTLCDRCRARCGTVLHHELGGYKLLAFFKVGENRSWPLVVGINVQVVAFLDDESSRLERLCVNGRLDICLVAFGILRTACQESSGDILVHFLLISYQVPSMHHWVDRWMRLVVLLALSWVPETPFYQSLREPSPAATVCLFLNKSHQIVVLVELICFRSWVWNPALRIQSLRHLVFMRRRWWVSWLCRVSQVIVSTFHGFHLQS